MRTRTTISASAAMGLAVLLAVGCTRNPDQQAAAPSRDIGAVSPALAQYDVEEVQALWEDPTLSARDRGLITITALIANGQSGELFGYTDRAIDDGVSAAEISETVTHLAFYTGWPTAMSAVPVIAEVFDESGIEASELPEADPEFLPLDEEAEAARARTVQETVGGVSPGVVEGTERLFNDLWLRPDLAPRDRSLVTVVALIATAQSAQIPFHLNRAMDNGLTVEEVDGLLAHIVYFTGWPKTMSAIPVVDDVLASRT